MQAFTSILKKPDIKGSLTLIELPFNPAQTFNVSKGTIKVYGTINGKEYRNKLISRGNGLYVMTVDKISKGKIFSCFVDHLETACKQGMQMLMGCFFLSFC